MDVKWLVRRICAKCAEYMTPVKHIYSIPSRQGNTEPAVELAAGKALCQNGKRCFWTSISHRKLLLCSSNAGVAQLGEHELPKLGVAGSNPVARSMYSKAFSG